jgi:hypothetical protein
LSHFEGKAQRRLLEDVEGDKATHKEIIRLNTTACLAGSGARL